MAEVVSFSFSAYNWLKIIVQCPYRHASQNTNRHYWLYICSHAYDLACAISQLPSRFPMGLQQTHFIQFRSYISRRTAKISDGVHFARPLPSQRRFKTSVIRWKRLWSYISPIIHIRFLAMIQWKMITCQVLWCPKLLVCQLDRHRWKSH